MSSLLSRIGSNDPTSVKAAFAESLSTRVLHCILAVFASTLLLVSLKLPLWQMRLEAPQYHDREALHIAVHPNALRGDLRELSVLDQYIGVHVPAVLPQFKWLPGLLIGGAILGVLIGLQSNPIRPRTMTFLSCVLAAALAVAAIQAMTQIHRIGHNRDQKTVLAGMKDFTPPFLGTNKIAQFTVSSRFGLGAWLIGGALALQLGSAFLSRRQVPRIARPSKTLVQSDNSLVSKFGRDDFHVVTR